MAGVPLTNYEVYVREAGRWMLHASFELRERDKAMAEAKELDRNPHAGPVKVIKEIYDPRTNKTEEIVVYLSAKIQGEERAKEMASGPKTAPAGPSAPPPPDEPEPARGPPAPGKKTRKPAKAPSRPSRSGESAFGKLFTVLAKILIMILASVGIAAVLTALAGWAMDEVGHMGFRLSERLGRHLLFGVFVVGFLGSAALMFKIFLGHHELPAGARRAKPAVAARPAPAPKPRRRALDLGPSDDELRAMQEAKEELEPEPEPEPEPERESEPEPEEAEKEEAADGTLGGLAGEQKTIMNFLSTSLATVQQKRPQLDAYNKFGLNLFLAGVCDVNADEKKLGKEASHKILQASMELLGTKADLAKSFCAKYEQYLMDPKYLDIYNAGRSSYTEEMGRPGSGTQALAKAIDKWNERTRPAAAGGPVTVMFTDLSGSTAMTQALGDEKAQVVVRTHNTVVRSALQKYGGKEIKHTGDGIMASFSTASGAVEGAIYIQRAISEHNRNNSDTQLHIKVGINAGEAIAEDDDLFGSTIQMSARVVDKCKADQIMVTDIVRQLCAGKKLPFVSAGTFEMKGFGEPITLYQVPWAQRAADKPKAAAGSDD